MCYLLLLGGHASVEAADPGWSCRLGELALGVSSMEWIRTGQNLEIRQLMKSSVLLVTHESTSVSRNTVISVKTV